jgi:AAA15 family ATPase/GTPase
MKIDFTSGSYKSIKAPFSWDNIPLFSVITGENGSGKTQLL